MKSGIVEGGLWRLRRGQKELTIESIQRKYAKELAVAEPHQKEIIYQKIAEEFSRQKDHNPSWLAFW